MGRYMEDTNPDSRGQFERRMRITPLDVRQQDATDLLAEVAGDDLQPSQRVSPRARATSSASWATPTTVTQLPSPSKPVFTRWPARPASPPPTSSTARWPRCPRRRRFCSGRCCAGRSAIRTPPARPGPRLLRGRLRGLLPRRLRRGPGEPHRPHRAALRRGPGRGRARALPAAHRRREPGQLRFRHESRRFEHRQDHGQLWLLEIGVRP